MVVDKLSRIEEQPAARSESDKELVGKATRKMIGSLPIVGGPLDALVEVGSHIVERRRKERAEQYLAELSQLMGHEDYEETARFFVEHENDEDIADHLAYGYQQVMSCVHRVNSACVTLVVADYVASRRQPDLVLRRAGALIPECTLEELGAIHWLAAAYSDFVSQHELGDWGRSVFHEKAGARQCWFRARRQGEEVSQVRSDVLTRPASFPASIRLLARHDFLRSQEGLAGSDAHPNGISGGSLAHVYPHKDAGMSAIAKYTAPARDFVVFE